MKRAKERDERRKRLGLKPVGESSSFAVDIKGLPTMYMDGMTSNEIKQKLRKIIKQPSMIQAVDKYKSLKLKRSLETKVKEENR